MEKIMVDIVIPLVAGLCIGILLKNKKNKIN